MMTILVAVLEPPSSYGQEPMVQNDLAAYTDSSALGSEESPLAKC